MSAVQVSFYRLLLLHFSHFCSVFTLSYFYTFKILKFNSLHANTKSQKLPFFLLFSLFFNLLSHCLVLCYNLMAKHLYMLFLYPFHEIQSLNFSPRVFFLFQIPKMAQSRLEKVGTIYSRMRGLLATGAVKPEQVCTRSCGSGPVGFGSPCEVGSRTPWGWIWNSLHSSDSSGRIRNFLYWSDPELLVLIGSGTLWTGRIQKSLCWLVLEKLSRIKRRMIDIGKKSPFYFLQNVWKCAVCSAFALKLCKSLL